MVPWWFLLISHPVVSNQEPSGLLPVSGLVPAQWTFGATAPQQSNNLSEDLFTCLDYRGGRSASRYKCDCNPSKDQCLRRVCVCVCLLSVIIVGIIHSESVTCTVFFPRNRQQRNSDLKPILHRSLVFVLGSNVKSHQASIYWI